MGRRQEHHNEVDLAARYSRIGISAVAAACHQSQAEPKPDSRYKRSEASEARSQGPAPARFEKLHQGGER